MSRFLERVRIGRYGSLSSFEVGPFGPGLNIVYGPNEAGKSSVASFVGGVLFGWEEAHGVRNTYQPEEGERGGSLVFVDRGSGDDGPIGQSNASVVWRERNEDGLQGDRHIVSDLDNATYRTMFSLTSDELRSLRSSSEVTTRLLAAGSATGTSPSSAFVQVEQRIAALTAPDGVNSIPAMRDRLEQQRQQIAEESHKTDLLKQEDRERYELVEGRVKAASQLDELNGQVEWLHEARERLGALDAQLQRSQSQVEALRAEEAQIAAEESVLPSARGRLADLDAATERLVRDKLDEFAVEQAKATRAVDIARENSATSTASYEALLEIDAASQGQSRGRANRKMLTMATVLPSLAFIAIGVLSFVYGRQTSSLSFTVFGIGLMVLAFLLAAGALAVMLRPDKDDEVLEKRRKDAQWVMLQDQKKLETCLQAKDALRLDLERYLEEAGLEAAEGSIKQARALLDDAREDRARANLSDQRRASIGLRLNAALEEVSAASRERRSLENELDLPEGASLAEVDALIRARTSARDALTVAHADMNQRFGELDQRLGSAVDQRSFDDAKLGYHQLNCRLKEARRELVSLLLARRILEKSIAAWESRSQPEVYERASRLFAQMTDGVWTHMRMTAEGRLVAVSRDGDAREVRHLSLGTCQQLYLALRVAMLQHARSVGRSIPVIADDILVNFDAQRRARAAEVLADLAKTRQVIVFTCHQETVEVLRSAVPEADYLEL